jgi:hypothetical protein
LTTTERQAYPDGIRRVNEAPVLLAGKVLATLVVALPLSIALAGQLEAHLGPSAAAAGPGQDWWLELAGQASGLGATFTPSIIGFAAVLDNASGLLDHQPVAAAVAGATVAWLLLWSFLTGGVIDRYARRRPTRAHGFFAAAGTHFWRFLRLGLVTWLVHAALFGVVHAGLEAGYGRLTRDLTGERSAFALRAAGYLVFSALLAGFALLFDYTRIRIVVEDRRSALGSLLAAARFLARHKGRAGGLLLLNAAAYLLLVAAYRALSPGAPRTDMHLWLVLGLGQAYIVGRHYLRLLVYASETALFQGALAHAAYTAAPTLVWPDSPAVETITNAEPTTAR